MRKEKVVTITDKNRDHGKTYSIKEMGCFNGEKWGLRALSVAARAGVDVSNAPTGGMAAVAAIGIEGLLRVSFDEAEPLLDELLTCVRIIRDPKHPEMTFPLITGEDSTDIEEISTLLFLRAEVLKLHLDFLVGAARSKSTSETAPKSEESSTTSTSRSSSASPSRIVRRR